MKRDIYKQDQKYKNWKEEVEEFGVDSVTKPNSDILIQYLSDMEIGRNISTKSTKGPRSFPRLNNIRQKGRQVMIWLQDRGVKNITQVSEKEVASLFADIRNGTILTNKGTTYLSVGDYAKVFTSFWHWWMKVNRKKGVILLDISEEIDKTVPDGRFVYITKEKLDEMLPYFHEDEQLVLYFVFDSLIRAPKELMSLRVIDVYPQGDSMWVNISSEISKTKQGRKFNLLYCSDSLKKYIEKKAASPNDYLFDFDHLNLTKKMHKVAKQLWGDAISEPTAKGMYSELGLYDLRHSGAIHLRLLASKNSNISLDSIRHRAGWVDFKMLNYYTKFIGLDGSIDRNELVIPEDKSRIEKEIDELKTREAAFSQKFMKLLEIMKDNPEEMSIIMKKDKARIEELFKE